MTRPKRPTGPKRTEHADAVSFFGMVRMHENRYPELRMLFSVPNGSDRHPAVAGKLKAEGVRRGVSDYIALVPKGEFHGLAIELKTADGGAHSKEQTEFINRARANGYRAEFAHGWVEAWRIACDYFGIPFRVVS